ncbi:hypothetical protein VXR01_18755, partial [Acinetobacter baumannii]
CFSMYIFMATFIGLIMNSKCQQTLILRKNKEAKLFYVLTTMDKEDIADKINEYWEYSTSVGYDFDE